MDFFVDLGLALLAGLITFFLLNAIWGGPFHVR